jgi:(2Fe-2S) ferredoxin
MRGQAESAETQEVIAVFRPARPGDADAVLRCVRILRSVQAVIERRGFCKTGKGGGIDNSCGTGKGGGADSGGDGGGSSGARYREAKTKEDAESVAAQYAKKVSYRGVDVESANRINKAVDEFFQQHPDMPQLESIEAKKFTGSSSTGNEDAAASYHMLSHKMQVNTAIMGSQKKWDEYTRKGKEAESIVAKALAEGRLQGRQKEIAEQHLSRGSLVDDSFGGAITHELGHHFDAKVLMKMPISDRKALMDRRPQYESRLSGYASTNAFEYFAESYVAYRVGRDGDIDPELRAIFDKRSGKK